MYDVLSWVLVAVNWLGVLRKILFQEKKAALTKGTHCAAFGCSENTVSGAALFLTTQELEALANTG